MVVQSTSGRRAEAQFSTELLELDSLPKQELNFLAEVPNFLNVDIYSKVNQSIIFTKDALQMH